MKQRLTITLDEDTTKKYLQAASKKTEAELSRDILPSGPLLQIEINPPFPSIAFIATGSDWQELGEVSILLEDVNK